MQRTWLLILLLVITVCVAHAQQYNFRNWTLEHGLPQSKVVSILQDNQKHLWLATRGGVSRFDGTYFKTFTKRQGLSSNNVSVLFQDSRNQIWIGTVDNGLNKYSNNGFVQYGEHTGLPEGGITAVAEDLQGKIWVATNNGIYHTQANTFVKNQSLPQKAYTALHFTKDGTLWAGSKSIGLYRLQQDSLTHFTTDNSNLPSDEITVLSQDPAGKLWVGTSAGLATIESDKLQPIKQAAYYVTGITHDQYKNTWVAFKNDGLVKVNEGKVVAVTKENGLRTNNIVSIAADSENNIWVGTNGYGLQQYKAPWFVHYFSIGQIEEPRIVTLSKDKNGMLWAGSDNGLIVSMPNGSLKKYKREWPVTTSIYSLLVKDDDELWVGTSHGAWHIANGLNKHYTTTHGLPADEIRSITEDGKGTLWFATANGVARFQNGLFTPARSEKDSLGHVFTIFTDSRKRTWLGAETGIYTLRNDKIEKAEALAQFNIRDVTSIAEDSAGTLYFGGFNYGLLVYNTKGKKARLFSTIQGLPNDGVKSLFIDNSENLWIGTNNNVLKVDLTQLQKQNKLVYKRFSNSEGFRGLEVCHNCILQDADSTVWFGTSKGLSQYIPRLDRPKKEFPELLLKQIRLFMRPANWKEAGIAIDSTTGFPKNLKLPFNRNHITFDYHAICLTNPSGVRYRYKLAGYDERWSEVTEQPFATYANLAPGNYTFQVLGRNSVGNWTPEPVNFDFEVNAPIWQREWFIALLLLALSGLILAVVRLRERGLKKMNKLLDLRVKHRTRLLERKHLEKEMLLKEIHHRVKNNLQIVISLLNLQARHVKDPQAQDAMQAIRSRVRSMSLLHERLYQHDNLAHIDLENYFREICESLYDAFGVTEEQIELVLRIPPIKLDIDSAITLGLIVNELVSNSLKYAFQQEQAGRLAIVLEREAERYKLTVADNGTGIQEKLEQPENRTFGLNLVASLSKKLDGELLFENNNGTKAILYFVLPS